MPLSEIIDRYTITKLKSERTSEDVSNELNSYQEEIDQHDPEKTKVFIEKLYEINGRLWDTEVKASRGIASDDVDYEQIGRLAVKVREINCERNGVKAEVVDCFSEGFKEIKINYTKTNYGKNS